IISDDAAIEILKDRTSYANILLDLATRVQRAQAGLPMARACTVCQRVERILGEAAEPARLNWGKRTVIAAAVAPAVALSAATIAFGPPSGPPAIATDALSMQRAAVPAMPPLEHRQAAIDTKLLDRYVGYYAADPNILPDLVLTVTREGDHLFVQRTGQAKL